MNDNLWTPIVNLFSEGYDVFRIFVCQPPLGLFVTCRARQTAIISSHVQSYGRITQFVFTPNESSGIVTVFIWFIPAVINPFQRAPSPKNLKGAKEGRALVCTGVSEPFNFTLPDLKNNKFYETKKAVCVKHKEQNQTQCFIAHIPFHALVLCVLRTLANISVTFLLARAVFIHLLYRLRSHPDGSIRAISVPLLHFGSHLSFISLW